MASKSPLIVIVGLLLAGLLATEASAQVTSAQKRKITAIGKKVTSAGRLFVAGKHRESGALVEEIQGEYVELATGANADLIEALDPVYNSLLKAHALLELEGVSLKPLKKITAEPAPMPAAPNKPPVPAPAADAGVSFARQVAPMLVAKCGGCHVRDSKGKFGMASYTDLMRGSAAGAVVFKGDASGSRLVEVIESGDMPRGGGKIAAADLTLLKTWINQGAKFDGTNPAANLTTLASAAKPAADAPMVMQATGEGTVSFAAELAPVLAAQCLGCHGSNRPRNNLSVLNFAGLLRGGDAGPPVVPGSPEQSLLIAKLKGTADGQQMPLNAEPLADAVIAKFETWIKEGAKFDGPNANAPMGQVAALARAQGATHEQLSADRAELAAQNWKLGMPGVQIHRAETENFLIVGNRLENTLKEIGQQAETIAPQVADIFGAAKDKPLVKGRMTLYVFDSRYDYSEFGQMVERRRLPNEWRGHWTYSTVDAYGAVVPSRSDQYKIAPLLAQQLAGVYVSSIGNDVPAWFAEGSARVAATRIAEGDPRVASWDESLPGVYAQMKAADDFLTGKLPPEAASLAAYSFADFLMANSKDYRQTLKLLREGRDFNTAFSTAYGGSPAQVATQWAAKVSRGR